jgi:peptidoglycan/xylan/chitin deacetylase (PgdA/CDA1 family)
MNGRALRWAWATLRPARHTSNGEGGARLTVIRHHRVYGDAESSLHRLGVSERVLEGQLRWLARHARVSTLSDGVARLKSGKPGHWVAITFDDGYADNVERALPLLQATRLPATFYLTSGLIESRGVLWWDEIAHWLERTPRTQVEWQGTLLACGTRAEKAAALDRLMPSFRLPLAERNANMAELRSRLGCDAEAPPCALMDWEGARRLARAGMELGAHTLHHPHLSLLDPDQQRREIERSRWLIEEHTQSRVGSLAYPGGDHSDATVEAARSAGFTNAVTTRGGDNRSDTDPFRLRRRGLSEGACLDPSGRFSAAMVRAELDGVFDGWRERTRRSA